IYCEAAGWGLSADAHHVAAPDPSGDGIALALRRAIRDAGGRITDVVHVNAHATATVDGDLAEARALRGVLGARNVPVTALKGHLGHLQGAAGGVEAVAAALTLHHGVMPPTVGCAEVDDAIGLDVVLGGPRALPDDGDLVLSNSFGFGGHNAVLALGRRAEGPTVRIRPGRGTTGTVLTGGGAAGVRRVPLRAGGRRAPLRAGVRRVPLRAGGRHPSGDRRRNRRARAPSPRPPVRTLPPVPTTTPPRLALSPRPPFPRPPVRHPASVRPTSPRPVPPVRPSACATPSSWPGPSSRASSSPTSSWPPTCASRTSRRRCRPRPPSRTTTRRSSSRGPSSPWTSTS